MTSSIAPNVSVHFDDPDHLFTHQDSILITRDLQAAVRTDTAALEVHQGATLNLVVHADPAIAEAASAPAAWAPTAVPGVLESVAEAVINTGVRPPTPHVGQDGDIFLNPAYLDHMFLNPNPVHNPGAAVPADQVDAVSLFAHEFIHVLGMEGFDNQQATTAEAPRPLESNFDALISFGPNGPLFNGPAAEAQNGGEPIELTSGDLYHVGDATHFAADLMNGDHIYTGTHYQPSALDDAILADLGYHLKPADHIVAGFT